MPTVDSIEIWRSVSGTEDTEFSLLTTLADSGGAFSYYDAPVLSQQVYIYKARRYKATYSAYSAFSPLVYVRGPWPRGVISGMPNTNIGVKSRLAVGIETTEGQGVKAVRFVDRVSGNLDLTLAQLQRKTLRGITGVVGAVPGAATIGGSIVIEPTPEGISELLCSTFGAPTFVTTAAVVGPPAVPAYQTFTWKDSFSQLPVTLQEQRGTSYYAFPGCRCRQLGIRLDKTQNDPIQMTFDMMGLNQIVGYTDVQMNIDSASTASYDTLPAFATVSAAAKIAGTVSGDARSCDITVNKNLGERMVLDGYRGANSHYVTQTQVTGTLSLYFSTEAELQRFMGQASPTGAYGAMKTINFVPIEIDISGGPNATNLPNSMNLILPNAAYEALTEPVAGPDAIMQQIRFVGYHDITTATSFYITIANSQTLATMTTPGTALATTPANQVTAYSV